MFWLTEAYMAIDIKNIIFSAVDSKRDRYFKLKDSERIELVTVLLERSDQALIDVDHELTLQKAIANVIFHEGNPASMQGLYAEIKRLFLTGDKICEAHFVEKIDDLLHEEWMEQNATPNEHFENDAMNRARDLQSECRPY